MIDCQSLATWAQHGRSMTDKQWYQGDGGFTTPEALFQGPRSRRRMVAEEQSSEDLRDPERPTNDEEQLMLAALERINVCTRAALP